VKKIDSDNPKSCTIYKQISIYQYRMYYLDQMRENRLRLNRIARSNNNYWADLFIETIKFEINQLKKYQPNNLMAIYNAEMRLFNMDLIKRDMNRYYDFFDSDR
jgi:hypothetical protein